MICLICSDFPRNQMIDTIKTLPVAKKGGISEKGGVSKKIRSFFMFSLTLLFLSIF